MLLMTYVKDPGAVGNLKRVVEESFDALMVTGNLDCSCRHGAVSQQVCCDCDLHEEETVRLPGPAQS